VARRLLRIPSIMQIPYDLEFVHNRPTAAVRAVALDDSYSLARRRREPDMFDAILAWLHRLIGRLEKR
jgi:hypothetical protein